MHVCACCDQNTWSSVSASYIADGGILAQINHFLPNFDMLIFGIKLAETALLFYWPLMYNFYQKSTNGPELLL